MGERGVDGLARRMAEHARKLGQLPKSTEIRHEAAKVAERVEREKSSGKK